MPKRATSKPQNPPPQKPRKATITMEATSYLNGLFQEFKRQVDRYSVMTDELLSLEARIELSERTLCLHRDHLAMTIENTDSAMPHDWDMALKTVQFVGVRLADACKALLREHRKLTPEQILGGLNSGMYRFRSNSPFREIHAALLRQPFVERVGKCYVWTGEPEKQLPLRLRVMNRKPLIGEELEGGKLDPSKIATGK